MKRVISLLMIVALAGVFSCKKDKQEVLGSSDAKAVLSNSTNTLINEMDGMQNTEGFQAISNLEGVNAPFSNPMKSTVALLKTKSLKSLKSIQGNDFNFEEAKGEWEYNYETDSVIKKSSSDKVIIWFPSDSNHKDVNDAKLTIYEYASQQVIETDKWGYPDTSFMPTKLKADVYISTKKVIDVSLTASYNSKGTPLSLNATVSVDPYSITATFADAGTSQSASVVLKKSDKVLVGAGVKLSYKDANKEEISYIDGWVQLADVKVQGNVNAGTMTNMQNPSAADINANVHLSIVRASDGAKVGDIKAFDENGQAVPYIVFADGTREKAETYVTDLSKKLDELMNKKPV